MGKLSSKCWKPPDKGSPFKAEFTMSYITGPHLDTGQWLRRLDLREYNHIFKSYNGVEDILSMSERELKALGIKNGSHRTRMMTSLIILRDKYERADSLIRSVTAPSSVRHSLVHSRESLHSSPCLRSQRHSLPPSRRSSGRFSMEPLTGTEASPEELKKALEWELSLDNIDLRSHAWYHGTIPRPRAEELMSEEGDFLIRDCISRPGDYVLTCRWKSTSLHFVINKVVFQPFTVYERIQYQFEDDCFDTVPDLVTYYVGNKRPISAASGAVISKPVNRSMPLSYYATRYGLECQMHYAALALEKVAGSQESLDKSPLNNSSENLNQERRLSQPAEVSKLKDDTHPSGVATMPRSVSNDYPRKSMSHFSTLQHGAGLHSKHETGSNLSFDKKGPKYKSSQENVPDVFVNYKEETKDDVPPPKPSRIPSKKYGTTYSSNIDESKSGNNEAQQPHLYSELNFVNKPTNGNIQRLEGTDVKNNDWTNINIKVESKDGQESNGFQREITIPEVDPPSSFDLTAFSTVLLPTENKPLDPPALAKMRCMLLEGGAKVIASHLTKVDLDVLKLSKNEDLGLGVLTGFELLVLPQGQQLRLDLLERTECLKYFVAITILTCGDEDVRAQVLNKWIMIAIETKTALGNLYGFTGIMQGLALPQISKLRSTWLKLRQTCTETAFTYETKLRPTLKNMQECSNPQAPNTSIPYLLTLICILQRHLDLITGQYLPEEIEEEKKSTISDTLSTTKEKGKILSLGQQWEHTAADYGLQLLITHLEIGRTITQQWPMYKRNSEIVLEHVKYDDLMLDVFRTEFHLRFLWGSKGCHVTAKERYSKFLQVLNVMSERCEPDP